MIWPLVRALARQGARVTVVASGEHARLCEQEVGRSLGDDTGRVHGVDAEQERFTRLWRGAEAVRAEDVVEGVATLITFLAADRAGGAPWHEAAAQMFPGAARLFIGPPDTAEGAGARARAWALAGVDRYGKLEPRCHVTGPIIIYTGAGGSQKRVPDDVWAEIARSLLGAHSASIELLIGRNELETGASADGVVGLIDGGMRVTTRACADALTLADAIRHCRVFIGGDTGPTHLAAQLGVPTIALFGPTDPGVWGPVGPRVRVIAPAIRDGWKVGAWPDSRRIAREIREIVPGWDTNPK